MDGAWIYADNIDDIIDQGLLDDSGRKVQKMRNWINRYLKKFERRQVLLRLRPSYGKGPGVGV